MREKIFELIEANREHNIPSRIYDFFMMITIAVSLFPLAVRNESPLLSVIDKITMIIFIVDYVLRFITADYKVKKKALSFIIYPFTPMAIIDLIAILPSLILLGSGFKLLKIFKLLKTLRVFRIFKFVRYSKNITMLSSVLKRSKRSLLLVCALAIGYILFSALAIFNVEPDSFSSFFDAVYWAAGSLSTLGYTDTHVVSTVGKTITMVSSLLGIVIVALPVGIITAGYMQELSDVKKRDKGEEDPEQKE